jgi:hypothetical protein
MFTVGCVLGSESVVPKKGVHVERLSVKKEPNGRAPLPSLKTLNPFGDFLKTKRADLLGDAALEQMVERKAGAGLEIRNEKDEVLNVIDTSAYLTDFSAIPSSRPGKSDLVLYLYPTRMRPQRQGTFQVMTMPDQRVIASWDESHPPGRFGVGLWHDVPVVAYFQRNDLVVRRADGELLERVEVHDGAAFGTLFLETLSSGYIAVVGSGDGYTPYHTVLILDRDGEIAFQEIDDDHARGLIVGENGTEIDVITSRRTWRYRLN